MSELKHIFLDGASMKNERDFHRQISKLLDFGPYYGNNPHALWDMLGGGIADGFFLHWKDSDMARKSIGEEKFRILIFYLDEATKIPISKGCPNGFCYVLE
jgi:ribonuclease inhibitor